MPHFGGREEVEHGVGHTEACAQDGNESDAYVEYGPFHFHHRRFDGFGLERQIACGFCGQQNRPTADVRAKNVRGGFSASQGGERVLNQRILEFKYLLHKIFLLGVFDGARFADDRYFDHARVADFVLNAVGNFVGENQCAVVVDLFAFHDHTQFATGLNGIALVDPFE